MKFVVLLTMLTSFFVSHRAGAAIEVQQFSVFELTFEGDQQSLTDSPAADVQLRTTWAPVAGGPRVLIHGFFDGDGKGGSEGNVFKVRFSPTLPGVWKLLTVESDMPALNGQHQGLELVCVKSAHPGFWLPSGRWMMRSNGSRPYIVGNTFYSFLSETGSNGPTGSDISSDVMGASDYFNKLRFAVTGDHFPHPTDKPFLDDSGRPTDDGDFSHRPNPAWFHKRVDLAVRIAFERDMIADLILNGPDVPGSRSVLRSGENNGDPDPFLRYVAARYGSYPNVWITLSNEYDIRQPRYTADQMVHFGYALRKYLAYSTPVSVHRDQGDWNSRLNTIVPWNTHLITQNKMKSLQGAADFAQRNFWIGGGRMPLINDELAYEGEGDGWTEEDVIEAFLGALVGGSYASTGEKSGNKLGQYFAGNFDAGQHASADNLRWLRQVVDAYIKFYEMEPDFVADTYEGTSGWFRNTAPAFRSMSNLGKEYLLATNGPRTGVWISLPGGSDWEVRLFDCVTMEEKLLAERATGRFEFDAPASRAALIHFRPAPPPAE